MEQGCEIKWGSEARSGIEKKTHTQHEEKDEGKQEGAWKKE